MGLGGEHTKFKLADFDRTIRACEAILEKKKSEQRLTLESLPTIEPSNDVNPVVAELPEWQQIDLPLVIGRRS
jgi:hypothetical protein